MGDFAKDINSSFPNNKVKALLNIIYTSNWITSHQNEYFKPFGISPQQYNILRILRGAGTELKVQVIKERMIERAPNATRLMDKLCTKQLIKRHNCDNDRRVVYVEITKKGMELLEAIASKNIDDLLDNLSENEAKNLSDLLDKIR
ncbi:MAG: MarR family transcriptional regulator [Urechidicola sp.]|nr:MarR family transcriptional regulator [Urechidicola sp.]